MATSRQCGRQHRRQTPEMARIQHTALLDGRPDRIVYESDISQQLGCLHTIDRAESLECRNRADRRTEQRTHDRSSRRRFPILLQRIIPSAGSIYRKLFKHF